MFQFQSRWKEELVVTGPGGSFVLEMPIGILSVYLPTAAVWPGLAPAWAKDLWPALHGELADWCRQANARLCIDASATVQLN